MNIPAFRPDPPSLLGALIGELDESGLGHDLSGTNGSISDDEAHPGLDQSSELENIGFVEDQDLDIEFSTDAENISLEEPGLEAASGEEGIAFESDGLSQEPDVVTPADLEALDPADEHEIEMNLEALPGEIDSVETPASDQDEDLLIDLDDITIDTPLEEMSGSSGEEEDADREESDPALDFDSPENNREKSGTGEIELQLDDLTVNETGELEIGTISGFPGMEGETGTDDISLDQTPLEVEEESEDQTLLIDEASSEDSESGSPPAGETPGLDTLQEKAAEVDGLPDGEAFDPDDISIDEDEDEIALGDALDINENFPDQSQNEEFSLQETLEVNDLSFDEDDSDRAESKGLTTGPEERELDLQEMFVDSDDILADSDEDDISLDLENMDLELDLSDTDER